MNFFKDKDFLKKVLLLSLPIACENLILSVLNIFDQMMVGWLPSDVADNSLSAVLLANQVVFIFQIILFASCNTVNLFIAQYTNNGRAGEIPRRTGFVLTVNSVIIALVACLCGFLPGAVIGIFNPQPAYQHLAEKFLRVVALSFIPMGFSITLSFTMRAIKKMRVALTASVVAVGLNICLNYLFMFGGLGIPAMGLVGAAWGTVVSRTAELLIIVVGLAVKKYPIIAAPSKMFKPDGQFAKSYIKNFIPILCNELFWVLSSTLYLFVYDKLPDSSVVLASVNIAQSVDKILSVAMIGVGSAVSIIMGNVIGEGDREKAHDYAKKSFHFSIFLGVILALCTVAAAFFAPAFFMNVSERARVQARNLLFLYAVSAVFRTCTFMQIIGILRSGGDTTYCMLVETFAIWLVSVPMVLVGGLVFKWNVYALYSLSMVSELIKVSVLYFRSKTDKWIKFKNKSAVPVLEEEVAAQEGRLE